jgi:transcriptional regulator with PAS, ATPase and Fis domain
MSNADNLMARRADPAEIAARFTGLVQSPLRAGILRFLCARPDETFDVEALMQTFGRMRLDVDNCVRELVAFGIAKKITPPGGGAPRYGFVLPEGDVLHDLLDEFLERRATVSSEDRSPAVQRFREMIGRDEKMLVIFEWIRTAAKSDISVLILGPTGSGKELVARMIHELSRRATHRFQAVNCAALPDTLFESEIFGYEKGAFTGAHDRKPGRLELANNGTLFLDEIGDMSLMAQAKLLRVLEERRFERLGGNTSIEVNFRLISATNRPLDQFVRDTRFREDLYYRVNAFSIRLPSLRERSSDIPVLAQRFLARYCAANGLPLDGKSFAKETADLLMQYHWPGNIRELESTVARAALSSPGRVIRPQDVEFLHAAETPVETSRERLPSLADAERAHIARVLERVNWNKKQAAAVLEISRGTLYRKIVEYGLEEAQASSRNRTDKADQ